MFDSNNLSTVLLGLVLIHIVMATSSKSIWVIRIKKIFLTSVPPILQPFLHPANFPAEKSALRCASIHPSSTIKMKEEMPNERMARFGAICKKIQVTENEVNVHVRNLDRLKKKLVVVSSDDWFFMD